MTTADSPDRFAAIHAIDALMARARQAQATFADDATQDRYDQAALAAGWAIMEPGRNRALAELAVQTTGLGNVPDKITKNHRKTLGLLRDIRGAKTCGEISYEADRGLTKIARPKGVIGAIVPSTNPGATPANNVINALKGGNAIILSPSPKGVSTCELYLSYLYTEFDKLGLDHDLVQMIPPPGTKAMTQRLLEVCDLVVATGSQDNVRRAYSSGTPALGVGAGNVAVIVDETADLTAAAEKIAASKTFDNATSCSSENALVVVDAIYDDFIAELAKAGGALIPASGAEAIVGKIWPRGMMNRAIIAKDAPEMLESLGLNHVVPADTQFIAIETADVGPEHKLSGEKLSRIVALYRASDFDAAAARVSEILAYQGAGHSVGLHSMNDARAVRLGHTLPTCRVIVNQAHCFATGGAFNNALPFSLSMGCGSWGGNSIDENLNWRHFINVTNVVRPITPNEPSVEEIFASYAGT